MGRPAITVKPRYSFAPLEALLRVQLRPELNGAGQERGFPGRMAEVLGVDRRQVIRWQEYGLTAEQADRLAVALGVTPWALWPEWGTDAQERARERTRKAQQKWRRTRKGRAITREQNARYKNENAAYLKWQKARYVEANRHAINERRRARYHAGKAA